MNGLVPFLLIMNSFIDFRLLGLTHPLTNWRLRVL